MRARTISFVVTSLFLTALAGLSSAAVMGYLQSARGAGLPLPVDAASPAPLDGTHPKEVAGLWTRWPDARSDGDKVRFWFFHPDGIGLYRYGKIGLNTTNSFDWHVEGKDLVVTFRKTGEVARTRFELGAGDGKPRSLVLLKDPKEPHAVPYTFVPPPAQGALAPDLLDLLALARGVDVMSAPAKEGSVPGRLWINQKKYATGGMGFSLYQLKEAAIDGRGVGWHHVGDYNDWSTEALTFRYSPSPASEDNAREAELEVWFTVRGEHAKTIARRAAGGRGAPSSLTLFEDPRDYWHLQTYKDAGPSFGSFWSLWLSSPAR